MDQYLVHHGISGQKWGERNGPPYPLGASNHSAREKKAGTSDWSAKAKKEASNNSSSEDKEKFHLTDNQKKAIKIGAAVVATGLAAYGGYRLYKSGKLNELASIGRKFIKPELNDVEGLFEDTFGDITIKDNIAKVAKESNIPIRTVFMDAAYDCENLANPGYDPGNPLTSNNCLASSIAFCLERLGLNVTAKPLSPERLNHGYSTEEVRSAIKGLIPDNIDFSNIGSSDSAIKHLSKSILESCDDEHNVGMLTIRASNGLGHDMAWEKLKGSNIINFYDPATKSTDMSKYFEFLGNIDFDKTVMSYRLDDVLFDGDKLLELFVDKI